MKQSFSSILKRNENNINDAQLSSETFNEIKAENEINIIINDGYALSPEMFYKILLHAIIKTDLRKDVIQHFRYTRHI